MRKPTKHKNTKTIVSFDTTTVCSRVRAGRPCAYCYVQARRTAKNDFRAKQEIDHEPYEGWVITLRKEEIAKLNRVGGVRMFSFGDYMPAHRKDVKAFLDDCASRGLYAKAITKVPLFLNHFHDHPALTACHISIDTLKRGGSNISHKRAQQLREQYPKVAVRCVVLNQEDEEWAAAQDWVDILTPNHVALAGVHCYNRAEKAAMAKRHPGRVCCAAVDCENCKVMCRVRKGKLERI